LKKFVLSAIFSYPQKMPRSMEEITDEVLALPSESRALLADKLVESLDSAALSHINQTWLALAKRRRDDVRSGKVHTVPGDKAMAQVRRTLGK
jgi:putative addiction module component (TIGR02574 family)